MENGASIRVWGDKWLPSSSTYKVVSPRQFLHAYTRVNELISQDFAYWKTQVIDAVFLPREADMIKSIPLSLQLLEDKLIWVENANGKFSVRSAYRFAMESSQPHNIGSSLDDSKLQRFWRLLWKIPAPHKVRHFTWRACHEILPTKQNLMQQKVLQ